MVDVEMMKGGERKGREDADILVEYESLSPCPTSLVSGHQSEQEQFYAAKDTN
jgi:hypothetical protein